MSNLTISYILAGVLFGLLYLLHFQISKWKTYHIFPFGSFLKSIYCLIVLIAALIVAIYLYISAMEYWENDRARVVTEVEKFKLGWSKDDLLFHKGPPPEVSKNKNAYVYGSTIVFLENDRIVRIIYDCAANEYSSLVKIGGVSCGSSLKRIEKIYGVNSDFTPSYDKLWRTYNFPKYNLGFVLSQSRVKFMSIYDPTVAPDGYVYLTEAPKEAPTVISGSLPGPDSVSEDDTKDKTVLDHCAPNLSKADRLHRLGMKGQLRQTGYDSYTAGNYEIVFSNKDVIYCR